MRINGGIIKSSQKKVAILSLGGSLIVPDVIDHEFLKMFKIFIEKQIKNGWKFIIVTGGGRTSRRYQEAASTLVTLTPDDLDWLGIHSTRLNAHLIRTIFRKYAYPVISKYPEKKIITKKPLIVASGWKPGWSTDYVSVKMCKTYGITKVLNLSNINYAYTKDPDKFRDAEKLTDITWKDFQKIVGKIWIPGANLPFDPIASTLAKKLSIDVYIVNGKKIKNLEQLLSGKTYIGTHIHN